LAAEAGFKWPVALTRAAWASVVEVDEKARAYGQDQTGRLWDVLMMALYAIRRGRGGSDARFSVIVASGPRSRKTHHLNLLCGPGDEGEPVITIMLPAEA
jgi:hypothetical protein